VKIQKAKNQKEKKTKIDELESNLIQKYKNGMIDKETGELNNNMSIKLNYYDRNDNDRNGCSSSECMIEKGHQITNDEFNTIDTIDTLNYSNDKNNVEINDIQHTNFLYQFSSFEQESGNASTSSSNINIDQNQQLFPTLLQQHNNIQQENDKSNNINNNLLQNQLKSDKMTNFLRTNIFNQPFQMSSPRCQEKDFNMNNICQLSKNVYPLTQNSKNTQLMNLNESNMFTIPNNDNSISNESSYDYYLTSLFQIDDNENYDV